MKMLLHGPTFIVSLFLFIFLSIHLLLFFFFLGGGWGGGVGGGGGGGADVIGGSSFSWQRANVTEL